MSGCLAWSTAIVAALAIAGCLTLIVLASMIVGLLTVAFSNR